ncbi:cytosine-purine permease [Mycena latifolia]|nr:cytosine-purine permease [Mycena latifolia]
MAPALKIDSNAGDAPFLARLTSLLRRCGVETHGIAPIPKDERTDTRTYQLFLLWFSSNMNLTNLVVGAGGPVVFNLSLRNTAAILAITKTLSCIIPAYLYHSLPPCAIFGPKLGMRAMVQALYVVTIPSALNVLSIVGFLPMATIIGGQILASASDHLTPTAGIFIIALISLVVSFCGYKVLHYFESIAWIPTLVGAFAILSFAATVAAYDLSWCMFTPDYGVYHDGSSAVIFTYTYLGILFPTMALALLGAAFAAAAPGVPAWNAGYDNGNNLGGLVAAILEPCGWFGRCLVMLMALAIAAPTALVMYSFGMSLMNVSNAAAKVPRCLFAIVATALCIPLAVAGQTRFYDLFVTGMDVIGYWCASYAGIVLTEHVVFRHRDLAQYRVEDWDDARKLPPGLAALLAFFGSFFCIIPCMDQTWYTGSIAKAGTGDIGVLVGFVSACILYGALRPCEMYLFPGHSSKAAIWLP